MAITAITPVLSESLQLPGVNVNLNVRAPGLNGAANGVSGVVGGATGVVGGVTGAVGGVTGAVGGAGGVGGGAVNSLAGTMHALPNVVPNVVPHVPQINNVVPNVHNVVPQVHNLVPQVRNLIPQVSPQTTSTGRSVPVTPADTVGAGAPTLRVINPAGQEQVVRTPTGQNVLVGNGAQVVVREDAGKVRVQNLTGTGKQVRLEVKDPVSGNTQVVKLDPGTELVTSKNPLTADDVKVADGIARRNISVNGNVAVSEIDVGSVLKQTPALSRLVTNPSNADEKKLGNQLLKTAAALLTIRGGAGFEFGEAPPAVTPPTQLANQPPPQAPQVAQTPPAQNPQISQVSQPVSPAQASPATRQLAQSGNTTPLQIAIDATRTMLFGSHSNSRQIVRQPASGEALSHDQRQGSQIGRQDSQRAVNTPENRQPQQGTSTRKNLLAVGNVPSVPATRLVNPGSARNAAPPVSHQTGAAHHTGLGPVADNVVHNVESHPALAVVLLLLFAFMLGIMTLLAATARKRAAELEAANRMLNEQMNERLRSDAEIVRLNRGLHAKIAELNELNDELTKTRDKAVEGSRLKSEFVANISHEIRTPITAVLGMIGLLKDTGTDEKQGELVQMLEESARSLLNVINDILDFSKIEAGMLLIQSVDFTLRGALKETLDVLSSSASQKGIELRLQVDDDVPGIVRGDPFRLRQVILNLVGNAIKFTSEGYVLLRVTGNGPVTFSVEDTGIGIPEEARNRLFQPFAQADGTTTRRFGGTGLGLSITKRLVQLMGGEIDFQSVPGEGSKFWFSLPFESPEFVPFAPPPPAAVQSERTASGVTTRKVLVAEDSPVLQKIVKHQLASLNCQVTIANNGREAVDAINSGAFDLILMDWQMPELDGIQATQQIRATESGATIPIVAMTANAMEGDRLSCLNAGMNDYISKPFTVEQLRKMIDTWLPETNESSSNSSSSTQPS